MTEAGRSRGMARLKGRLGQPRVHLVLMAGLVAATVLAIITTDLATGGDAEPPPSLGSSIETTARTRVATIPTLAPVETPPPVILATSTPSTKADALARDAERLSDLEMLQDALAEYRDRFDEYPNSDGQIQTLCAYEDLDKGCDLEEVLDEKDKDVLVDPLGEPLVNGYWYVSDGKTYTIWTRREGPASAGDPVCREAAPHLKDIGSLFCVTVRSASP